MNWPSSVPESAMDDFSSCSHTAIISDLHLCEAEPVNPRFPLWKKYKTKEFFYDDVFCDFLKSLERKAEGKPVELILNGDIFDFDSVTTLPENPPYSVNWLERVRSLRPTEEKAAFKMKVILEDHKVWTQGLRDFILRGNRAIFVIGNHDLELRFPAVQKMFLDIFELPKEKEKLVRFVEWFYISNKDTLIEHGHQHDPYCVCQDPLHPFVRRHNQIEMRLPFGNWATRYLINGMGYFNPHVDTNFIMTLPEYVKFFFKYMLRSQPLLVWTWFWGSLMTFIQVFQDRFLSSLKDPMAVEDLCQQIAKNSNTTPGVVRQMHTLRASPASNRPWLLARELWLDRAVLILGGLYLVFNIYLVLKGLYDVPLWSVALPSVILLPPFIFYAKMVGSNVTQFKEPNERIILHSSWITGVSRIVYGHTHITRHEVISGVEHLNSGSWSPAFLDVECTRSIDQKTYVWIYPGKEGAREAALLRFEVDEKGEKNPPKNENSVLLQA